METAQRQSRPPHHHRWQPCLPPLELAVKTGLLAAVFQRVTMRPGLCLVGPIACARAKQTILKPLQASVGGAAPLAGTGALARSKRIARNVLPSWSTESALINAQEAQWAITSRAHAASATQSAGQTVAAFPTMPLCAPGS